MPPDFNLSVIFYRAPQTRSPGVLALSKELETNSGMRRLNLRKGEHVAPYIFLADLFTKKNFAPTLKGQLKKGKYILVKTFAAADALASERGL